ncbi:hypothetical protein K469DRAFT_212913 [Zopfia rhizophila CBS 207.26]|uniref:Uncharacterized protein n=1 Tax=Zopfia rhizophila CBS 207.26 TaxID=1314779 RepID=A0A6A6DZI7_9PEZI|nr:hypothetical protein K469DRAFT_212913 [Zopfia rhizophila CBS 207.26]
MSLCTHEESHSHAAVSLSGRFEMRYRIEALCHIIMSPSRARLGRHFYLRHVAFSARTAIAASLPRGPRKRKLYASICVDSFAATLLQVLGCEPGAGFTHRTTLYFVQKSNSPHEATWQKERPSLLVCAVRLLLEYPARTCDGHSFCDCSVQAVANHFHNLPECGL